MRISFIIASFGRDKDLQECIASIEKAYERAKNMDIEILVIFQDTKENKTIKTDHPELSTFYYIKKRGLSLARNFAIKRSTGEYLVFLDDDAMVKEDFLLKIEELMSGHNDVGAFSGCLIDPRSNKPFSSCYALKAKKVLGWCDFQLFRGSAIILRRDLQKKIGFFDERFGSGARFYGAEDTDIFFRIKQAGERVVYFPDLVFYHNILTEPPASKVFNYFYAAGALFMKQILKDPTHCYFYVWLIFNSLGRNLLRLIQGVLFPASLWQKNIRFQYGAAFRGMLAGMFGFLSRGKCASGCVIMALLHVI